MKLYYCAYCGSYAIEHNGKGHCCYCGWISAKTKVKLVEIEKDKQLCEGCCKLFVINQDIWQKDCCKVWICKDCKEWLICCKLDQERREQQKKKEIKLVQITLFEI